MDITEWVWDSLGGAVGGKGSGSSGSGSAGEGTHRSDRAKDKKQVGTHLQSCQGKSAGLVLGSELQYQARRNFRDSILQERDHGASGSRGGSGSGLLLPTATACPVGVQHLAVGARHPLGTQAGPVRRGHREDLSDPGGCDDGQGRSSARWLCAPHRQHHAPWYRHHLIPRAIDRPGWLPAIASLGSPPAPHLSQSQSRGTRT